MNGLEWLAVVNAIVVLAGASLYLGMMWFVRLFLAATWPAMTLTSAPVYFGVPVERATAFFRSLFVVLAITDGLLVWTSVRDAVALVCAIGATAAYVALALWFQFVMRPVNDRILNGPVADDRELRALLQTWDRRHTFRLAATVVYWVAAVGALVALALGAG